MASVFRSTLSALLLLLLLPLGIHAAPTSGLTVANPDATNIVPNSYIIKYKKDASDHVLRESQQTVEELMKLYPEIPGSNSPSPFVLNFFNISNTFFGLHVLSDDPAMVRRIAADPAVEYVLYDTYVTHAGQPTRQLGARASLARVSQAQPMSEKADSDYMYDSSAGEGTTVYIIDSGIYIDHPEFQGRARHGYNAIDRNSNSNDDNGHGTNVAGIVGSATYGVAKRTELVAVKVLDSTSWGTWAGIIDGMQWASDDIRYRRRIVGRAVINMSIQSDRVDAMNDMVDAIHGSGIPVVVCAGNYNKDASTVSPASAASAITVGAIDALNDNKADFSDYGSVVDVFAPGVHVVSTSHNGGTSTFSGTSQAAPHVAGIAALLMSSEGLSDPDAIAARINRLASDTGASVRQNAQSTTNLIANNGFK